MTFDLPPGSVPFGPIPSPAQLAWQRREFAIFVHFGVNTFTGREWGDGSESPAVFNPSALDVDQWVRTAKAAGAGHLVLTAKHHDGFCLWPSKFTQHSVKHSPYQCDPMREFVEACARHDVRAGLYLSPWDRHEPAYGDSPAYNRFYLGQLHELLTEYGELVEIWFDGACAEGPNGRRQEYDWPAIFEMCRTLQPNAVTFGDGGTDVRWIGNERGIAGDPNWSTVQADLVRFPGDAGNDQAVDGRVRNLQISHQLQHGDPAGDTWRPGECDVSIRPGWFYHADEDDQVRSVENLVDLYFQSVGRNGFLLLNVPPTPAGRFHAIDVDRLLGMRRRLVEIFSTPLEIGATIQRSEKQIELTLPEPREFNMLSLAEAIELGQRVSKYRVCYRDGASPWAWLLDGNTIGCRKIDRFELVRATSLKIEVLESSAPPILCALSLHRA